MTYVRDLLLLGGMAMIGWGIREWSLPASVIFGGMALVFFAAWWSWKSNPVDGK